MPGSPAKPRLPGPRLALAIPLLIVGVLAAIASFVGLGTALLRSFSDAPTLTSPASDTVVCHPGTYVLYVESGSTPLTVGNLKITSPDGAAVPVDIETVTQSISRDGATWSGSLGFVVAQGGAYTVSVSGIGTTLITAPSFATTAKANLAWIIGVGLSLLTAGLGLILLIVALVKRSGARKRAAQYTTGSWGGPGAGGR